ncbi:hypothetical protein ACLKA7_000073 [Drosophila subpalustris]
MSENATYIITEQHALLKSLTKSLQKYKGDASLRTEAHLAARLESLAAMHEDFRQNHQKLVYAGDNEVIKTKYIDKEVRDLFEETYIEGVAELKGELNLLHRANHQGSSTPFDESAMQHTVLPAYDDMKLPRISIPTFSGKFIDWPAFKEVFQARVHNCTRLNDLHRFHYLRDSLSEDAARDIQHLTLIESNYQVAWKMLEEFYDNKRVLFQHYMDVFDQQSSVQHDSSDSLKCFIQTCRSCVHSLDKLGVEKNQQTQVLVYYMLKKLPGNIRVEWEKSLSSTQSLPTFDELCKFLDAQYRLMITSQSGSVEAASKNQRASAKQFSDSNKQKEVKTALSARQASVCIVCNKEEHPIRTCKAFNDMSVSERRATASKHRLCFNCLGFNHQSATCGSRRNCVDLLLGSDIYDELMLSDIHRGPSGSPIAQNTQLGYIVSGKVEQYAKSIGSHTIQVWRDDVSEELDNLLRKFWELEQLGEESADLSNEDKWCEDFFVSTHKRLSTGKYVVRLPILTQLHPDMVIGSSYRSALKRLSHLERRFRMDSNLENVYAQTISEYLQLHQMKPVAPEQRLGTQSGATGGVTHCYLPHHPVIKESSSTTKVRVVFDGSMRTSNGRSLNDILASGPKLHTDLPAILINWRSLKYVFMADVQMMYRCIDVNDEDAQYQRILWKRKQDEGLDEYYCSTVMFGTRSAPFLAIRVMHQLAADEGQSFPLAVDVVKQQMYVDDILSGADNVEQAENIKNQVIGLMHSGTFELRKWASNDPRLLQNIPLEHLETKGILDLQTSDGIRALGVYWTPLEDSFRFRVNFEIPVCIPTKRIILSTIARLFDPMGWLSPIVITAKMLMQVLWKTKLKWDDHVPTEVQKSWDKFVKELPNIASIQIPRYITGCSTNNVGQLHIFCDASAGAYGAAAYLRIPAENGHFHVELLLAKSKVMPVKPQLTIPRAELCAAVVAVKIFKYCKFNMRINVNLAETMFWSDSMITLGWIRSGSARLKTFVANRINKILELTEDRQWRHIASEDNPADLLSRGMSATKLADCALWWHGPPWLKSAQTEWPRINPNQDSTQIGKDDEIRNLHCSVLVVSEDARCWILERYSSYTRLVRVLTYVNRFIHNCRIKKPDRLVDLISYAELSKGIIYAVRLTQMSAFPAEWKALSGGQSLAKDSSLLSLNPYFDLKEKVIRLGGRLRDALLPENEKHPYILPYKHHVTDLVIRHSHASTLHGGTALTLNFSVWSLGAVLEIHRNLQEIDVGVNSMMHPGLTSSKGGECSGYAKQFNPSSATREQL